MSPTAGFVLVMFNNGKGLNCLVNGLHMDNWRDVLLVCLKRISPQTEAIGRTGWGTKSIDRTCQLSVIGLWA